jgi:hypothetical protein
MAAPVAREEFGQLRFVVADPTPEGNEFCVAKDPSL